MKIRIQDMTKSFLQGGEKIEILKGLSLEIGTTESVAILGQSGSGKSTLLSLLAGLDLPDSGQVIYEDILFSQMNDSERTRFRGEQIGLIFQSHHLVSHLTALENVMLPLEILHRSESKAKAVSMLEKVGLASRMHHLSTTLSGGEAQRVAIARALVTTPKLLLADEPSGQLDQETGKMVMNLFFEVLRSEKMSTILVTHDPELAKRCDRTLVLNRGRLQA